MRQILFCNSRVTEDRQHYVGSLEWRFNKCVWYNFRDRSSSGLFELGTQVVNNTITSGFQLENKLFEIIYNKCRKSLVRRFQVRYHIQSRRLKLSLMFAKCNLEKMKLWGKWWANSQESANWTEWVTLGVKLHSGTQI